MVADNKEENNVGDFTPTKDNDSTDQSSANKDRSRAASLKKQLFRLQSDLQASVKSSPKSRSLCDKPPSDRRSDKNMRKRNAGLNMKKQQRNFASAGAKFQNEDPLESGLENPDLGPFLLKQTKDMISSGENPQKTLEFALRATKSFEVCANGKPNLELVMSLHVLAALYCSLGQYNEAIPVLERSIEIPVIEDGQNHALAKFAGCMQLGDTYAMLGQIENSILCYTAGLEIQRQVLGEMDHRVGETCRYVAEAHVQALQFDEAENLCQIALNIHRHKSGPASLEEAADRRLMGLICEAKGDYEAALEHYVLASMSMAANGLDIDVASIDCSIGDAYLSLARYDEAIFAYQKGLTVFKSSKGENHPAVASVFVRLADLYNRIGKFRDSKSYCENALRIYEKSNPGIPAEEIASGLIDVSAIYQSMNEFNQALKLLKKALKIYGKTPGQQSTIAGIEAQMGVMYYMMGNYADSYNTFKSAVSKFRASGEKKSALFGIALNQMGLACVQRYAINEAADLFEEARSILEKEYGPCHPDTLGVYSNLAGTYDAMGRLDDAIEILDYVVGMREEKLGTANPDVDDEKRRLGELLKDAGKVRNRKSRSLVTLLDRELQIIPGDAIEVS
ncbi:kinesin light chain, putative [Ricinus communis]|uniref:Kinesin light chain, putative n=2 Tax=Ricinus communis TaxID=3988 RepID=B9RUS7_RICCO|nr:kinesin light chain, putative [Ricinus communis]|eukprot:XP_002517328.3 protein KINESIN LIGHT CHAIN-RELATED 2 [Ricinus communis]